MVVVMLVVVFAVILVGLLSWQYRTRKRLKEITEIAGELAQGNYEARVPSGRAGCLGRLGQALNSFGDKVQITIGELSKEKTQLSAILSTLVEGVVAVDQNNKIVIVNAAVERIFRTSAAEVHNKPFLEALRHSQLNSLLQRAANSGKECVEEVQLFTPEERIFEAYALPIIQNGLVAGVLLALHDITRIRQLEQMRRDFVANVSHELRTPVASIKGYAETLSSGAINDSDNRLEFVRIIEKHADRLSVLIDDLLDLSAIESGRRLPMPEPVNLTGIVQEIVQILSPQIMQRNVNVENALSSDLPVVSADKSQIRQVLTNFMDNAVKFNREKGTVRISGELQDKFIRVMIKDAGIGIPDKDLPHVFERFYRVDKARSRELGGTGLGLSIVKHIIENHGGHVGVESKLGEGSTFWFTLPI